MADDTKHRLTLHIPKPLHEAATKEAKARFMSLTGLILAALSKEVAEAEAKKP